MEQKPDNLKKAKEICQKIFKWLVQFCRTLIKFLIQFFQTLFRLLKKFWQNILKPLAQKIMTLPWKEWAQRLLQFMKTSKYAKPVLGGLVVVIIAVPLCAHFFGGKTDQPVSEVPQEPAAAESAAIPGKTDPAQALEDTAAGKAPEEIPEYMPEEAPQEIPEETDSPNPIGGAAEEPSQGNASDTYDSYERSEIYQESYNDTMEHMDEIIALYWQGDVDYLISSLEGTTEEFYEAVNTLDPTFFDNVSSYASNKYADNLVESHLIKSGIDLYFSDNEIGKGLRDIGEQFFLGMLRRSLEEEEQMRSDMLRYCTGNTEYVLARSSGSIGDLVMQISKDSGHYMAVTAIENCYEQIHEVYENNITSEMGIVMNNGEGAAEIEAKWDSLQGRMDALKDSEQEWNDNMEKWTNDFLSDLSITQNDLNAGAAGDYIYTIFDKDGAICGTFLAPGSIQSISITDTGICSWSDDTGFYAVDKNANELYSKEGYTVYTTWDFGSYFAFEEQDGYYPPSPCGNILHKTTADDFDHGSYETLEIERPDGTSQEVATGYGISPAPVSQKRHFYGYKGSRSYTNWSWGSESLTDVWRVDYKPLDKEENQTIIVDINEGKIYEKEAYYAEHPDPYSAGIYDTTINEQYSLDTSTWKLYETDNPENIVADFSAGQGLVRLFYDDIYQRYWAVSKSGYYYVLDKDFERIHEPVKLEEDWWDVSPYGIIQTLTVPDEESGFSSVDFVLYDPEGNQLCVFPKNSVKGFIGDVYEGFINGVYKNGCFNLLTHEQMYINVS